MTGYQSKKAAARDKMAQPAQEPWRESASDYERGFIDGMQKQAQSSVDKAVNRMAQRPWVGLTDESITQVIDLMPNGINGWMSDWDLYEFARAVLAKSKEKNNG